MHTLFNNSTTGILRQRSQEGTLDDHFQKLMDEIGVSGICTHINRDGSLSEPKSWIASWPLSGVQKRRYISARCKAGYRTFLAP